MLVVVRGMPESPGGVFCPYCLAQVTSLSAKYEEFKSRGAEVVLVFPGPSDKAAQFTKQVQSQAEGGKAVPYPVCVDMDCSACDRLGIRGDLAKPSTFILDPSGPSDLRVRRQEHVRPPVRQGDARGTRPDQKLTPPQALDGDSPWHIAGSSNTKGGRRGR